MSTESYERLEALKKWSGLTTHAFAMKIGLKRSENIYCILRNREKVSLKVSSLILATFPEISRNWFMYGEGDMIVKNHFYQECKIPFYANASKKAMSQNPISYLSVPEFEGADFAIRTSDKALEPLIPMGSMILLKRQTSAQMIYGQPYYVESDHWSVVRIVRCKEGAGDEILLESINKQYDTISLKRQQIQNLYLICGALIKFI